jgi:[acyl-carrier-protein] S-malonyltransferase
MKPQSTAFLFPGQGSQEILMGFDLAQIYPSAKEIFSKADDLLGFSLSNLMWEGPEAPLNETINTQPALLTHSVAVLQVLIEQFPGLNPVYVAGHSMGELTALVATGASPFEDVLKLTRKRGELMKRAGELSPGGMAAILALDIVKIEEICTKVSTPKEIVQVANDNCPGQVVISGNTKALEKAMVLTREAKAKKVVRLAVSIAAHTPLMAAIQDEFNQAINAASISDPQVPIIGNVYARPLKSVVDIRTDLRAQLNSRVRWTESIQFMLSKGINTFIEIGSGDVLSGLVKRIDRKSNRISIGKPEDFEKLHGLLGS